VRSSYGYRGAVGGQKLRFRGFALQAVAELGVDAGDQGFGALADGLAVEVATPCSVMT
jgi:hypothetical protein